MDKNKSKNKIKNKKKDSHEVKAAKLEVDKLELKEKLTKRESELTGVLVSFGVILFGVVIFAISVL